MRLCFADLDALSKEAAASIAARIRSKKSGFVLGLSGGSTPIGTYRTLARMDLPWEHVTLALLDERFVPETDSDSNAAMIRREIVVPVGIPEERFVRPRVGAEAAVAASEFERQVRQLSSFDLAILGMGADGHTASLFPGGPELEEEARWAMPTMSPAGTRQRISLTIPALGQFQQAMILVEGAAKRKILRSAWHDSDCELPICQAVERIDDVEWFVSSNAWPD